MKKLLAVVFSLCCVAQANAHTINLGNLAGGSAAVFANSYGTSTTFSDAVVFTVLGVSDISGGFLTSGINNFKLSLGSTSFSDTLGGGSFQAGVGTFLFSHLGPGTYTLDIGGLTSGGASGAYFGALNVATVPEADTWLMIIVGAGLVGLQLRRRQKSIQRGVLVPQ